MPRGGWPGAVAAVALLTIVARSPAHPLEPLPRALWTRAAAAHLLRRAAFGATPAEIDRVYQLGLDAAVVELLAFDTPPYAPPPPELSALAQEDDDFGKADLSEAERRLQRQARARAEHEALEEVRLYWLDRLANSPHPFQEKMVLFWHGHFTSGAREVKRSLFMLEQNELFRRSALGDFRDLLVAISQDRAMLVYLDNARNNKRTPNENYARELLELFTLGVGHYSESDVKAAARAFTGWSLDRTGFCFRPLMHDAGPKTFLGTSGNLDGHDVIDVVLAQPACSRWLARSLLEFYCTPEPQREVVERLAALIRRHDYDLRPVLTALLKSQAFYSPACRGAVVKSPVDLFIGTARSLGIRLTDLPAADRALRNMGQTLLQPPNVKGWPGGMAWINTATLYQRYNVAATLLTGTGQVAAPQPSVCDEERQTRSAPAPFGSGSRRPAAVSRQEGRTPPAYDPRPVLAAYALQTPAEIVDFYVAQLLARPPPDDKRAALVDYLADGGRFDSQAADAGPRVRKMLSLLVSTPEYQVE